MTATNQEVGGKRLTISVIEAGKRLGLGKQASYDAAHRGELPIIRMGKQRVGEASKREWAKHRSLLGLPPDWRYVQSRRRGGRQTAAQWLAENGREGEQ